MTKSESQRRRCENTIHSWDQRHQGLIDRRGEFAKEDEANAHVCTGKLALSGHLDYKSCSMQLTITYELANVASMLKDAFYTLFP